jgi:hypothetical protein
MAFPQVAATSVSVEAVYTTNHDGLIPAGTAEGELLVAMGSNYAGDIGSWPVGWNLILTQWDTGTNRIQVAYKWAGAAEAAFVWTTPGNRRSVTMVLRITGASPTVPPEVAGTWGNDFNPDSPNLAASWGSADNLWISIYGSTTNRPPVTYPANYLANQATQYSGGIGGAGATLTRCSRELAAASENPGNFTTAVTGGWTAATIVVGPPMAMGIRGARISLDYHLIERVGHHGMGG